MSHTRFSVFAAFVLVCMGRASGALNIAILLLALARYAGVLMFCFGLLLMLLADLRKVIICVLH